MPVALHRAVLALAALSVALASPAMADGIDDEPLARFEEPLCPGIIGLEVDGARAMVARIRENAARLGLRTAAEDGCNPNLMVVFLVDGQDYLQRLSRERGYLFNSLSHHEQEDLLAREGPARAWLTTETRTRDGMWVGERDNAAEIPMAGMWSAHSLIYVPTRQDITAAMVLIDRDAMAGRSITQLADYATLHGLAAFVPAAAPETPTIQRLFSDDPGGAIAGLSAFDLAYLERLYSSIPNLPASMRLQGLEGMARQGE
jgi:hypothetical protein